MMKNLRVKFVGIFVLMMIVAGVSSLIISTLIFSESIERESKKSQQKIVDNIIELYENTDFTLDKVIDISNNDRYEVIVINDLDNFLKSGQELDNKSFVQIKRAWMPIVDTIVHIDEMYIKISNSFNERGMHLRALLLTSTTLVISTVIATLISSFISKVILKPVRELSKGTEEVAKGNFDIKIDIPKDYEFGKLTENFNKMVHELSGIETLRSDFVSNVSHEIKTPLASIQGFAKLVQDKSISDEERSEFADIIISESSRLSKLTSNILKLSKLENQDIITEKVKYSLDEQIRCAILILEPEWSEKYIELDIDLDEVNINANEDLLQQVWVNLIGNAIKFTDVGGSIEVKLMDKDDSIVVKILDTGIGIDDETKKHIFEKFYQGDKSHLSNGNGLGLALVKRIVELCNGKIEVQSKSYKGTTFTIILPKIEYNNK